MINAENEMLKANCSISNRNVATPLAAIKEPNEYYASQMQEIKRRIIRTEELIDTLNMREKQYFAELAQLNSRQKAPMSEVEVRIDAPVACKGAFTLTYYVQNAGWYPSYDIRSDGLSKPVEIAYKANVFQNTGEEWPDVALSLSSSNPTTGSIAPELQTWWLDFGTTPPLYDLTPTNNTVTGTVYGKNYRPLSDVIVKVAGTTIGTSTDARGRFSITVPNDAKELQFDFAGYQTQTMIINDSPLQVHMIEDEQTSDQPGFFRSAKYTTTVEFASFDDTTTEETEDSKVPQIERTQTLLGYEFAISQPYTIASDGKVLTVEIGRFDLPARYTYHATPKIDQDAFLVAETTDWEKLNLMEGEANIYFENTFVGKSILSPRETGDTLRFSMGRDRGIRIERTRENDYSKQRTLGSNRTQTVGWKFTLRNTRTEPVELVLTDQLPISRNNSITITEEKLDGGTIDPNSGIVTWHLELKPGTQRDLRLRYAVKYPKNQELISNDATRDKKGGSNASALFLSGQSGLLDALVVLARARIDADLVARVDEQRHANRGARIDRCGFERVGRSRIALHARLRVGYLHIDDRRQLGRENLLLLGVEHHLDDLAVGHQVVVVDQVLVDVDLLEGLRVHEVHAQVILVGELVGTALDAHRLDLHTGCEGIVQHATVLEVLEFRTHESGALARLHMLEIDNLEGLAVQFDAHADLDVCGSCHNV